MARSRMGAMDAILVEAGLRNLDAEGGRAILAEHFRVLARTNQARNAELLERALAVALSGVEPSSDLAAERTARRNLEAWRVEVLATLGEVGALGPIEERWPASDCIRALAGERDRLNETQAQWRTEANRLKAEHVAVLDALQEITEPLEDGETWREQLAGLRSALADTAALRAENEGLSRQLGEIRDSVPAFQENGGRLADDAHTLREEWDEQVQQIAKLTREVALLRAEALVPGDGAAARGLDETPSPNAAPKDGGLDAKALGGTSAAIAKEAPPAVLHANPPVPEGFPGRTKEPSRVPMQELAKGLTVTDAGAMVPRETPAPSKPRVPTLEDRMEAIRLLAEGKGKAEIAATLGLASAHVVQGMTSSDKRRIERVRQAAPHDRAEVLAQIRAEIVAAKGGSGA